MDKHCKIFVSKSNDYDFFEAPTTTIKWSYFITFFKYKKILYFIPSFVNTLTIRSLGIRVFQKIE